MLEKFKRKEATVEEVQAFVSLANAAHKWANMTLQAYAIESKNRRVMKGLTKMNVMDEDTALEIGVLSDGKVKCEAQDKLITRDECLDYSGSHNGDCKGCDTGIRVKEILIDRVNPIYAND
jgi:hypothetical protein